MFTRRVTLCMSEIETTRCLALMIHSSQLGGRVVQICSCGSMHCSSGILAVTDSKFNVFGTGDQKGFKQSTPISNLYVYNYSISLSSHFSRTFPLSPAFFLFSHTLSRSLVFSSVLWPFSCSLAFCRALWPFLELSSDTSSRPVAQRSRLMRSM